MGWPRMVPGSSPRTTATSGNPPWCAPSAGAPTWTAPGFAPTTAGPGSLTSPSAGPVTITGAGRCCAAAAGSGCPATNGHRPGCVGAKAAATSAGRRCPRKPSAGASAPGTPRSRPASASAPDGSTLWPSIIFPARSGAIACPSPRIPSFGSTPPISPTSAAASATCLSVARAIKISAAPWAAPPRTINSISTTTSARIATPWRCARSGQATNSPSPLPPSMPIGTPRCVLPASAGNSRTSPSNGPNRWTKRSSVISVRNASKTGCKPTRR